MALKCGSLPRDAGDLAGLSIVEILSPPDSPVIPVFGLWGNLFTKHDPPVSRNGSFKIRGIWKSLTIFQSVSTPYITARDRTRSVVTMVDYSKIVCLVKPHGLLIDLDQPRVVCRGRSRCVILYRCMVTKQPISSSWYVLQGIRYAFSPAVGKSLL